MIFWDANVLCEAKKILIITLQSSLPGGEGEYHVNTRYRHYVYVNFLFICLKSVDI